VGASVVATGSGAGWPEAASDTGADDGFSGLLAELTAADSAGFTPADVGAICEEKMSIPEIVPATNIRTVAAAKQPASKSARLRPITKL